MWRPRFAIPIAIFLRADFGRGSYHVDLRAGESGVRPRLGLEGTARPAVAADLLTQVYGARGGQAISVLICCSCLGAINGTLMAGSRIYYVVGEEHRLVSWLGKWSGKLDGPVRALILQTLVATLWITLFGQRKGIYPSRDFYRSGLLVLRDDGRDVVVHPAVSRSGRASAAQSVGVSLVAGCILSELRIHV